MDHSGVCLNVYGCNLPAVLFCISTICLQSVGENRKRLIKLIGRRPVWCVFKQMVETTAEINSCV